MRIRRVSLSFHTRAAYIRTAIRVHMSTGEFSEVIWSSTKLALFIYLLMNLFDALHRIFFEDRKKHDARCGCDLLLWSFSACEIQRLSVDVPTRSNYSSC